MTSNRKLAAILAADVVGFSRLAGQDEERTLARLRTLRSDLTDPSVAAHGGRVFKRTGDGFLAEFRSVVEAARCAIDIQQSLSARNEGAPVPLDLRIGVHLGDVIEEADGDLMGDGVNIAARLEGVASPGTVYFSEDAYRQVKARLDYVISEVGPTRLKNIAEPVRVFAWKAATEPPVRRAPRRAAATRAALGVGAAAALVAIGVAAGRWAFERPPSPAFFPVALSSGAPANATEGGPDAPASGVAPSGDLRAPRAARATKPTEKAAPAPDAERPGLVLPPASPSAEPSPEQSLQVEPSPSSSGPASTPSFESRAPAEASLLPPAAARPDANGPAPAPSATPSRSAEAPSPGLASPAPPTLPAQTAVASVGLEASAHSPPTAESPAPEPSPLVVPPPLATGAAVAPAVEPEAAATKAQDAMLVNRIESALRRVGCYEGADRDWTSLPVQSALVAYARATGLAAPPTPSEDLLGRLAAATGRVCPLTCTAGKNVVNGRCVVRAAPAANLARPSRPNRPRPTTADNCFEFNGARICE